MKNLLIAATALSVTGAVADERPNIIFVLTDDQHYDLLGCNGNEFIETPKIDALAADGIRFTSARVTSSISTPSRTSILTGRYERSHGVNFNSGTALSAEAWSECYPLLLRNSGYYTAYIGKNHTPVGKKSYETALMDRSFDFWYAGHRHLTFYPGNRHRKVFVDTKAHTQVEVLAEGVTDFLDPNAESVKGAIRAMEKRPTDKPFFMNLCFNLPHAQGTSTMKMLPEDPELYRTKYRDIMDQIPLYNHYIPNSEIKEPRLPESVHIASERTGYDYVNTPEAWREMRTRQMQTVTGIDKLVGEIVDYLKKEGLYDNTIIIFSSDHGITNGESGLGGKGLCYESCIRVPFIVFDPRAKKTSGKVSDDLISSIDIAPTILDYAGVEIPNSYQGASLVKYIYGDKKPLREYSFSENLWSNHFGNPRCESVQDKRWKYIRYYVNKNIPVSGKQKDITEMGMVPSALQAVTMTDVMIYRSYINAPFRGEPIVYEELFVLKNDYDESTNLINDPKCASIAERLRTECQKAVTYARGEGAPKVNIVAKTITNED